MEPKEKSREQSRKKAAAPEEPRRTPGTAAAPGSRKKAPARKPAAKKTAVRPEARRRHGESRANALARRERPDVIPQPRPQYADDRDTRQRAEIRRPARTETGRVTAPKGTGPRKSAPQMSIRETDDLRRRQRQSNAAQARQPEKKSALQNFISGVKGDPAEDAAARAEQRRKERAARAEKKRKPAQRNDTPAVIYTQPAAFSRDRLLIQLLTVTAVVAALVLGMSVFFKVGTITVAGAETYSAWAIRVASGISEGDNLLTFSKAKAGARIQAELA